MAYDGLDRRKNPRVGSARFVVSYRILQEKDNVDITQTKNIGLGGMLLTTNREFKSGTHLALEIRLPFDPNPIIIVGKVLDSRQVIKDLLYDTRLVFLSVDEKHRKIISLSVNYYLKKG